MGRVGEEMCDTMWVSTGVVQMLDIIVIVVLAVSIIAEVMMLESMSMSQIAVSSRDEIMELVHGIWWIAN
jgi:hypothetical protein